MSDLASGPSGPSDASGPSGPSSSILSLFPSAVSGPTIDPTIATLEELMESHGAVVVKENGDKQNLSVLNTNLRELFRVPLFQWAAAGFPDIYIVKSFTIVPPSICSDGVTRGLYDYINYCLGTELNTVLDNIRSKLTGIIVSTSIADNVLRFHVSKS